VEVATRRTGEEIPDDRASFGGEKVDRRRTAVIRHSNFELTGEFHRAIGQLPEHQRPGPAARGATIRLREQLIREEAKEAIEALEAYRHGSGSIEDVAKELADVLCVTYGAAAALGIPMDEVYAEVHASNMTRVGGPIRADGKMLKGDSYRPPDLSRILKSY
jgi:predicted HAD superfamily Cof-like phosphohydrolase